jgi:hypothetical protein
MNWLLKSRRAMQSPEKEASPRQAGKTLSGQDVRARFIPGFAMSRPALDYRGRAYAIIICTTEPGV